MYSRPLHSSPSTHDPLPQVLDRKMISQRPKREGESYRLRRIVIGRSERSRLDVTTQGKGESLQRKKGTWVVQGWLQGRSACHVVGLWVSTRSSPPSTLPQREEQSNRLPPVAPRPKPRDASSPQACSRPLALRAQAAPDWPPSQRGRGGRVRVDPRSRARGTVLEEGRRAG